MGMAYKPILSRRHTTNLVKDCNVTAVQHLRGSGRTTHSARGKTHTCLASEQISPGDWLEQQRAKARRFQRVNPETGTPGQPARAKTLQKALGVDFATKLTGLAVSTSGLAPRPLMVLKMSARYLDSAQEIMKIAKGLGCDGFVVGLPVLASGSLYDMESDSRVGRRCRNFAYTLAMVAKWDDLPVYLVDESYTTRDAEDYMVNIGHTTKYRKKNRDSTAAALVLDLYFRNPGLAQRVHSKS